MICEYTAALITSAAVVGQITLDHDHSVAAGIAITLISSISIALVTGVVVWIIGFLGMKVQPSTRVMQAGRWMANWVSHSDWGGDPGVVFALSLIGIT